MPVDTIMLWGRYIENRDISSLDLREETQTSLALSSSVQVQSPSSPVLPFSTFQFWSYPFSVELLMPSKRCLYFISFTWMAKLLIISGFLHENSKKCLLLLSNPVNGITEVQKAAPCL